MSRRHFARLVAWLAVASGGVATPSRVQAQADPMIAKGVAFLRGGGGAEGAGECALAVLALSKAEIPRTDPALAGLVAIVRKRFSGTLYQPEKGSGAEIYEASVIILALANLDPILYRAEIEAAAQFLIGKQNANGSWDYNGRQAGDTSISQYAVLGLWEAENSGVPVNPAIWDRAAAWFLTVQSSAGSWTYHRDAGGAETISMTAAGTGSLLICARQLAPYRSVDRPPNPLLIPLVAESDRRRFVAEVSPQRIRGGIQAGINWLSSNFTTASPQIIGPSPFYALYGIERLGALADLATLGKVDWFSEGRRYLAANQRENGSFAASFGEGPNTSWAVLFLTKSTAKTIKRITIRRLGSGTLIGGRGLPKDLSQISVAGGKVIARPMDGAVEGMLAALEDPRVDDASTALAGLIARYSVEGAKALRPHKERFQKLLERPRPGGPPRRGLGAGPDRRPGCRAPPHRRPA